MKQALIQQEALSRATSNTSTSNYQAILLGFINKGIDAIDIKPRENVFTWLAWKAKGMYVCKDQHGVKISTWINIKQKDGSKDKLRPKTTTVFHISQVAKIS